MYSRFDLVALNPQPLPPRWVLGSSLSWRLLNPQPLPPKAVVFRPVR